MAVLSKVQDTWGNSLVRKKTMGLDGFPKQRKRQKQTGSSGTAAAEQEAQPFSKPAPAIRKQGPRAQAKAVSAGKENSPAAANAQADAQVTVPPSTASAPTVRSKGRCGQCTTCLNPRGNPDGKRDMQHQKGSLQGSDAITSLKGYRRHVLHTACGQKNIDFYFPAGKRVFLRVQRKGPLVEIKREEVRPEGKKGKGLGKEEKGKEEGVVDLSEGSDKVASGEETDSDQTDSDEGSSSDDDLMGARYPPHYMLKRAAETPLPEEPSKKARSDSPAEPATKPAAAAFAASPKPATKPAAAASSKPATKPAAAAASSKPATKPAAAAAAAASQPTAGFADLFVGIMQTIHRFDLSGANKLNSWLEAQQKMQALADVEKLITEEAARITLHGAWESTVEEAGAAEDKYMQTAAGKVYKQMHDYYKKTKKAGDADLPQLSKLS